jgi:hypothetical protein
MQCFLKLTLRFVYESSIIALLDTFTEFMYKRYFNIKNIFFNQMKHYDFLGRGDFGGSVGKGETNKILF